MSQSLEDRLFFGATRYVLQGDAGCCCRVDEDYFSGASRDGSDPEEGRQYNTSRSRFHAISPDLLPVLSTSASETLNWTRWSQRLS